MNWDELNVFANFVESSSLKYKLTIMLKCVVFFCCGKQFFPREYVIYQSIHCSSIIMVRAFWSFFRTFFPPTYFTTNLHKISWKKGNFVKFCFCFSSFESSYKWKLSAMDPKYHDTNCHCSSVSASVGFLCTPTFCVFGVFHVMLNKQMICMYQIRCQHYSVRCQLCQIFILQSFMCAYEEIKRQNA